MNFFTTPNSKNIIATLRIVTIEKSELTFLPILYFLATTFLLKIRKIQNGIKKKIINGWDNKKRRRCLL